MAVALIKDGGAGPRADNHAQVARLSGIRPQEVKDGAETARLENGGNVKLLEAPGLKIKYVRPLNLRVVGHANPVDVGAHPGRQTLAEGFGDEDVGLGLIADARRV